MKTMTQIEKLDAEWLTNEQKGMCTYWLKKGAGVYVEGPYMCSFHKKEYGYIWVDTGKKLLKLDGRGYDVKMQCETHPKLCNFSGE